jgi:hypothetical protein
MKPGNIIRGKRGLRTLAAVPFVLMLMHGNQLLAEAQKSSDLSQPKVTVGEIMLYVLGIVAVIAAAWFFGAGQSQRGDDDLSVHNHPHVRRHYDHPNDPHFRKLKKKTS